MVSKTILPLIIVGSFFACKEISKSKKNLSEEEALYGVNTNLYGASNGTGSIIAVDRIPRSFIIGAGIGGGYMPNEYGGSQFRRFDYNGGSEFSDYNRFGGYNGMNGMNQFDYGQPFGYGLSAEIYCFYKVNLDLDSLRSMIKKRKSLEEKGTKVPRMWEIFTALRLMSRQINYQHAATPVEAFYFDARRFDESLSQSTAELLGELKEGFNRERDKQVWMSRVALFDQNYQRAALYPQLVQQALIQFKSQRQIVPGRNQTQTGMSDQELLMARQQIELQMIDEPRLGCPHPLKVYNTERRYRSFDPDL